MRGYVTIRLLDGAGRALPTDEEHGAGTANEILVRPAGTASETLSYASGIPGPGEPTTFPCEPTAEQALMSLPGDQAQSTVPFAPNPYCEHGHLLVDPLVPGSFSEPS